MVNKYTIHNIYQAAHIWARRISRYTCPLSKIAIFGNCLFLKIDTKFGFKSIELAKCKSIFNQQGQK
jgi:hypothetical protein